MIELDPLNLYLQIQITSKGNIISIEGDGKAKSAHTKRFNQNKAH